MNIDGLYEVQIAAVNNAINRMVEDKAIDAEQAIELKKSLLPTGATEAVKEDKKGDK